MDVYETGRDEVLLAQHMHSDVSAISTQGWIQGDGKKKGHGVPFFKNVFRPEASYGPQPCTRPVFYR